LFSTPTQFAALGLVLIAGWLLGLASHPGGKKWKARYLAERDAHGATRKETDLRASAAEQRAVEAEHENARLVKAAAAAPVAAPVARTTAAPVSRDRDVAYSDGYATGRPGYASDGTKRGWFDFNQRR
jgi:hypothetical protein